MSINRLTAKTIFNGSTLPSGLLKRLASYKEYHIASEDMASGIIRGEGPGNKATSNDVDRIVKLNIDETFTKHLPGDSCVDNTRRQVISGCYSYVTPKKPKSPSLIHACWEMAREIGLQKSDISSNYFLDIFSGNTVLEGTQPYAMCYGGHQFGNWAGQLGDGRAINLTEVVNENRWALQLKGAGQTQYSRSGDGFAVLRSSVREYLCAEAMFHLGVPTTRSLSICLTGDSVMRDVMYNGNPTWEKGAVVCRMAPNFIRFGNFEILTMRKQIDTLRRLADYTIDTFYPEITSQGKLRYMDFFDLICKKTIDMIVDWQRVGFVHAVMNTDNMSISGLTIDYGPYGWLEGYDPSWTPNTTDIHMKRYSYGRQPSVALWNLHKLACSLFPLINDTLVLQKRLDECEGILKAQYEGMMRKKLGLVAEKNVDSILIQRLEHCLQLSETDMTIFFRLLSAIETTDEPAEALSKVEKSFYKPDKIKDGTEMEWKSWFSAYISRLKSEVDVSTNRAVMMNSVNPKYVLRNYMTVLAIEKAELGDYTVIDEFYNLLKHPYDEQPENEKWFSKRPEWARNKVGCSMLSCSS